MNLERRWHTVYKNIQKKSKYKHIIHIFTLLLSVIMLLLFNYIMICVSAETVRSGDHTENQDTIDVLSFVDGEQLTVHSENESIAINDTSVATVEGHVFYDTNNNGAFEPENGDFALKDTKIDVTYTYKQALPDETPKPITDTYSEIKYDNATKTETLKTDSLGNYKITDIPLLELQEVSIKVDKPFQQYELTTKDKTTNGYLTNGTLEQKLIYKDQNLNTEYNALKPGLNSFSDVGFYSVNSMSFKYQKQWPVDEQVDTNQPTEVTVNYSIGYYENQEQTIWKEIKNQSEVLSETNMWTKTDNALPAQYIDSDDNIHELSVRILQEAFTMRDNNKYTCTMEPNGTFTYTENDIPVSDDIYPYKTSFDVSTVNEGYYGIVTNSFKTDVYQINNNSSTTYSDNSDNQEKEPNLSVIGTVDVPMTDYEIKFTVTYADNEALANPTKIDESRTVQTEKNYNVDFEVPAGSYVKIEENSFIYKPSSVKLTKKDTSNTDTTTDYTLGETFQIEDGYDYTVTIENQAQVMDTIWFQKVWMSYQNDGSFQVVDFNKNTTGSLEYTDSFKDIQCKLQVSSDDGLTWEDAQYKYTDTGSSEIAATDTFIIKDSNKNFVFESRILESEWFDEWSTKNKLCWIKRLTKKDWNLPLFDKDGKKLIYQMVEENDSLQSGYIQYNGEITYNDAGATFTNPINGKTETLKFYTYSLFNYVIRKMTKSDNQQNFYIINYKKVENYTLNLSKIDGSTSKPLAGTKFTLYQEIDEGGTGGDTSTSADITHEGVKYNELASKVTTLNSDGTKATAIFENMLISGTNYLLIEKAAPAGYRLLETPMKINVIDSQVTIDGQVKEIGVNNEISIELKNNLILHMPTTGTNFTGDLFVVTGIMLLDIATIGLLLLKISRIKKNKKRRMLK